MRPCVRAARGAGGIAMHRTRACSLRSSYSVTRAPMSAITLLLLVVVVGLIVGGALAQTPADECQPIDGIHRHQPQFHIIVRSIASATRSRPWTTSSCTACQRATLALTPSGLHWALCGRRGRCSRVPRELCGQAA